MKVPTLRSILRCVEAFPTAPHGSRQLVLVDYGERDGERLIVIQQCCWAPKSQNTKEIVKMDN